MTQSKEKGHVDLWNLAASAISTKVLHVAVHHRIPELIADTARDSAEIARTRGLHEQSLHRVLRALAALGLITEDDRGRFALSLAGRPLLWDAENSVAAQVDLFCSDAMWGAWGHLHQTVVTGTNGFLEVNGTDIWDYMSGRPEFSRNFTSAMSEETILIGPQLAEAYDFSGVRELVDIGGNDGTLLMAVLEAHPSLCGVVQDTRVDEEATAAVLAERGLSDRCRFVVGDATKEMVPDCDAYMLKSTLYDGSDDRAVAMLSNCRSAMAEDGRVLVVEPLAPDHTSDIGPMNGVPVCDLDLLVASDGRVRTEAEFSALFQRAGLRLNRVLPLGGHGYSEMSYYRIIEGVPA